MVYNDHTYFATWMLHLVKSGMTSVVRVAFRLSTPFLINVLRLLSVYQENSPFCNKVYQFVYLIVLSVCSYRSTHPNVMLP